MKTAQLILMTIVVALFAVSADAQKKRPAPKPTPTPRIYVPLEIRTAKEKVSNQISNVTRFTDVLGPIAASIESIDEESKTKELKKSVIDANETNKRKVMQAMRNLRAGLTSLETEFRTKPTLRKYLVSIDGITVLGTQSEDAALAGRFVESRKPLLAVLKKLSDTFAAMP